MMNIDNKSKRYLLVITLLLLAPLAWFISITVSRAGKTPVNFIVAPHDTVIKANGVAIKGGVVYFSPGTYSLLFTRDGFAPAEIEQVFSGKDIVVVPLGLLPITEEAMALVRQDPGYITLDGLASAQAGQDAQVFAQNNPIIGNLPYRGLEFNIDYRLKTDDETGGVGDIVVQITTEGSHGRRAALALIGFWGFNPDDFIIEYLDR